MLMGGMPPPVPPPAEPSPEPADRRGPPSLARRAVRRVLGALGLRHEPEIPFRTPEEVAAFLADAAGAAAAGDAERFAALLWQHDRGLLEYLRAWHVDGAPPRLATDYVDDAQYRFLHTLGMVPLPPPARM